MEEIWKDISGYEGRYMVSNLGNVKSLNYGNRGFEKNLKLINHHSGYVIVDLRNSSRHNSRLVHVFVATAFIDNPENKRCVNHIDGNKHNNCVSNLEWVTHLENTAHAISTGLRDPHNTPKRYGKDHYSSKPVLQYDLSGYLVKIWDSRSDAARYYNCFSGQISNTVDKDGRSCMGSMWRSIPKDDFIPLRIAPFNSRFTKKKVLQFDLDGNLVREWESLDALKDSPYNKNDVRNCCSGHQKTHANYIWRFAAA